MSVVATMVHRDVWGTRYANLVTLAFDSAYAAGGEPIDLDEVELTEVDYVIFPDGHAAGFVPSWDGANVELFYADYSSASDGALIEVPNGTDVDAITEMKAIFIGTK